MSLRAALALAFAASVLVGCGSGGEVSSDDVKTKEQQAIEATKKLNGGKAPDPGQGQGSQ